MTPTEIFLVISIVILVVFFEYKRRKLRKEYVLAVLGKKEPLTFFLMKFYIEDFKPKKKNEEEFYELASNSLAEIINKAKTLPEAISPFWGFHEGEHDKHILAIYQRVVQKTTAKMELLLEREMAECMNIKVDEIRKSRTEKFKTAVAYPCMQGYAAIRQYKR